MMDTGFELSAWDLVLQLGRGLLIGVLLWGAGRLIEIAPITRARRRLLTRLGPVFVILVGIVFLASAVQELYGAQGSAMSFVLGLIMLGIAGMLWAPLRDLVAGVALNAGNLLRPGDVVQVAGVSGRIERMGYRTVVVLVAQGEVHLPYSVMMRSAIVRSRAARGTSTHVFRVDRVPGVAAMALRHAVTEGALQCHGCSIRRPPELRALEDGALEVTVFALDEGFGPAIESAVLGRVARLRGSASGVDAVGSAAAVTATGQ